MGNEEKEDGENKNVTLIAGQFAHSQRVIYMRYCAVLEYYKIVLRE